METHSSIKVAKPGVVLQCAVCRHWSAARYMRQVGLKAEGSVLFRRAR